MVKHLSMIDLSHQSIRFDTLECEAGLFPQSLAEKRLRWPQRGSRVREREGGVLGSIWQGRPPVVSFKGRLPRKKTPFLLGISQITPTPPALHAIWPTFSLIKISIKINLGKPPLPIWAVALTVNATPYRILPQNKLLNKAGLSFLSWLQTIGERKMAMPPATSHRAN